MKIKLLLTFIFLNVLGPVLGQVMLTNGSPSATVNFSATMQTTVGTNPSSVYTGSGFEPAPTVAGKLNSNAWEVKGWSFGDLLFGGSQPVDDFGRGTVTGGVVTPGMYAYTSFPGSPTNPMLLIQSGNSDFAPGTITLKIKNNGTTKISQLNVSYNIFIKNDEESATSLNFSHSQDNTTFINEPTLDYTSPAASDAFLWTNPAGVSPARELLIAGLDIDPGEFYYIRWTMADVLVSGERDEFGLDDITIGAVYGSPEPEINVLGSFGNTILSGDVSPSVAKGTVIAGGTPISTLLTTHAVNFKIQNLGGLPLNVSAITVTGDNASDFYIFPAPTATTIAPGGFKDMAIYFDPSDAGLRKARINIINNDSNENPYFFDIHGYGVIPIPDIRINGGPSPYPSNIVTGGSMTPRANNSTLYGSIAIGSSELKGWEIRNDCPHNAPILLTGPSPFITIEGANPSDFTLVTFPANGTVYPGGKKAFTIRFSPTAPGIRTALVSILNNDPDVGPTPDVESPFVFMIQGVGVSPEIDITGNNQPVESGSLIPSVVNHTFYDYLNVVSGTLDRIYTIKNNGNAPLTIGALTITGAQASDFSVVSLPAASLAANATTTFTIRFDPSATGLRSAVVNLVNSDLNETPYTFAINGYGVDYVPCAFGAVETIAIQNFDTTPATPVWNYTQTNATIAAGTAYGQLGEGNVIPRFLGSRSLQVNNATSVVTFANVNTMAYGNVELNLKLASLSTSAIEGADAADRVTVSISTNGGPWSDEVQVNGGLNSKWSFASGGGIATAVYDGNTVANIYNAGNDYVTSNGYGMITLTGLPQVTTLSVRITLNNDSTSEIWAIDNVALYGRRPVISTWNGSWTPAPPISSTKAIIQGVYNTSVHGNIVACQCEIRSGATVTVTAGNYLNIESEIQNQGTLVVQNNGSLVQHNDFAINSGVAAVDRNSTPMKIYDYTYWSSPVQGQTLFNLSPLTRFDKYYSYSPIIGNWVEHTNGAQVMQPAIGYIIRAPLGYDATPTIYEGKFNGVPNNGLIQTPINIGLDNMNLIGNPYPSAINAVSFLSNPDNIAAVEGTIYLWTHNSQIANYQYNSDDYAVFCYTGPVATRSSLTSGSGNSAQPTGMIASGQGFFIKGLQNNSQVTFKNSMRVPLGNNNFFKSAEVQQEESVASRIMNAEKNRVWLNLTNSEGAFKQTLIGYLEGATNGVDRGYDGEAIGGNTYVDFYSLVEDTKLAIQGRALPFDVQDKVRLVYSTTVAGLFKIAIDSTDGFMQQNNIYLEDKQLNVIHDLKQSAYEFNTEKGTFTDRFMLRYINETLSSEAWNLVGSGVSLAVKNEKISIFSKTEPIRKVSIYDILGRNVYESEKLNAQTVVIDKPVSAQQTLLVKIILESGQQVTRKVML